MVAKDEPPWAVWGDAREPVYEGTEEETKQFVEAAQPNQDLYIQTPGGKELLYEGGRWVEV